MKIRLALLITLCFAAVSVNAQQLKPVSIEDIMGLDMLGAVTPDAKGGVILQITTWDGGERFLRDLWYLAPSGEMSQLTFGGTGGGSHALSPDGKSLAFYGKRNGVDGIHVLPLSGREARTLMALPVYADNLRWAANGIFFTAPVFPDCAADFKCTTDRHEQVAKGTSALVYEELYYRPWNTWADGTHNGLFLLNVGDNSVKAIAVGKFDVPPIPFGGPEDYDVSKDGKVVVYAAKKVDDPWISTNDDIFEVVDGVEQNLTAANLASDRAPRLSPDGSKIAFASQAIPGFESDRIRLKILDRKTGDIITIADSINNWILGFQWLPDGKSLVVLTEEEGHLPLYKVEAKKGGSATRLGGRYVYKSPVVTADGKSVLATRQTMLDPPDLYKIDLKTGKETRLTNLNREKLAGLELPKVEEIRWEGTVIDGKAQPVHGFLVVPPQASKATPLPLVVFIHGGPQGSFLNSYHPRWNPLPFAAQGFVVALPNPTGSTGYGQDYVNNISRHWGDRPYEDIMNMVEVLSERPEIDGTKVCAMGGSYGGYMANWMEAKAGERFKCLVSHAGPSDLAAKYGTTDELWFPEWEIGGTPWDVPGEFKKWSPVTYAKDFKTPMLIIHGANDFRVSLEQAQIMFQTLRRVGVKSKLVVFPDEDHFINRPVNRRFWYHTIEDWLRTHLK